MIKQSGLKQILDPKKLKNFLSIIHPERAADVLYGGVRKGGIANMPAFLRRSPGGKEIAGINDILSQKRNLVKHYETMGRLYPEVAAPIHRSGLAKVIDAGQMVVRGENPVLLKNKSLGAKILNGITQFGVDEIGSLNPHVNPNAQMYGDKLFIKLFGPPQAATAAWASTGLGAMDVHGPKIKKGLAALWRGAKNSFNKDLYETRRRWTAKNPFTMNVDPRELTPAMPYRGV